MQVFRILVSILNIFWILCYKTHGKGREWPSLDLESICEAMKNGMIGNRCSGCTIDMALDKPPVLKDAERFFRCHGIKDLKLVTGSVVRW